MMNLQTVGTNTLDVEVTHISAYGIWLLATNQEFFMSYEDFPWFQEVTLKQILNVEQPHPGHFYWPDLEVDLSLEIIKNPKRFPLKSQVDQVSRA